MSDATDPRGELAALIRSKLGDGMTADQATDAVMRLFWQVDDDWRANDITTYADLGRGVRSYLDNRFIVCTVPREGVRRDEPYVEPVRVERVADRRIG